MATSSKFLPTEPAVTAFSGVDRIAAPIQQLRNIDGDSLGDVAPGVVAPAAPKTDMPVEAPLEGCAYCGDDVPSADTEFCSTDCARLAALED